MSPEAHDSGAHLTDPRVASEIKRRIGPGTPPWRFYDRRLRTPLNALLDDLAGRLGREPLLTWVDGGAPIAFAVTGFPDAVAVWSTRHLEVSAAIRSLILSDMSDIGLRRELARRLVLSVAAELLLRDGRQRDAARCLLMAVRGQGFVLPHADMLADLELASLDEAYAGLWFFAIAHEFGHFLPAGSVPDDASLRRLAVDELASIPAVAQNRDVFAQLVAQLDSDPQNPNSPGRLRAEMAADGLAVEAVIEAATVCMARDAGRRPAAGKLVAEIMLAHIEISLIERCMALTRAPTHGLTSLSGRLFLTTAALSIRSRFVHEYLLHVLGDQRPEGWFSAVNELLEDLTSSVMVVDSGLADAMRQMISPPEDETLLADVHLECQDPSHRAFLAAEHRSFLAAAENSMRIARSTGHADSLLEAALEVFRGS